MSPSDELAYRVFGWLNKHRRHWCCPYQTKYGTLVIIWDGVKWQHKYYKPHKLPKSL